MFIAGSIIHECRRCKTINSHFNLYQVHLAFYELIYLIFFTSLLILFFSFFLLLLQTTLTLMASIKQITLQRTWGKMPLWHKVKLLYSLLFQALFLPSSEDLDKMVNSLSSLFFTYFPPKNFNFFP